MNGAPGPGTAAASDTRTGARGIEPLVPVDDPVALRRTFSCFPSGVAAVCGLVGGVPTGMAASSFTSVSLEPPLVSVCIAVTSTTWPALRVLPRLGVSVLAEDHGETCLALSRRNSDRFAGVTWDATSDGAVFVHGSAARLDCAVHDEVVAGDHTIVLLRIMGARSDPAVAPLVFHGSRFRLLAAT